jgi:sarcosine oxidase, subunit delta
MKALLQASHIEEGESMLRIPCPYCGVRDQTEFKFGGPSHVSRPPFDASDEVWTDYLFNRENPAGIHYERWLHEFGCARWFNIARDTLTHEIYAVYCLNEPKPAVTDTIISITDSGRLPEAP